MAIELLKKKVVAITGASGFIGQHLCRTLLDDAGEIHALSRTEPRMSDARVRWHKVDLTEFEATQKLMSDIRADFVFHLCSYAQGERELALVLPTFRGELQTTVNVLTSVAEIGCERLIMVRSLEEPEPGEIPSSPYAAAKVASRLYARMFHQLYGLPVVMIRIFMAYGPGQSAKKVIPHLIDRMVRSEPLKILSPSRKVDWVYVDDVIKGLLAAAVTPGLEGKSIDIGSGEFVEISEVVQRIQRLVNSRSVVDFGPLGERACEQVRCADTARTHALMGWRPSVSLDAGLAKTVDYLGQIQRAGNVGQDHQLPSETEAKALLRASSTRLLQRPICESRDAS